ncbi:hypothetical protein L228DRAFT_263380 [Xylona heveae TC161]|uniref:Complex I intermediate-associated protein 84, mitochondrial n=1 Tax=Xylona heveae (strain CBS 132557 / TC161) TaxID=1328760 RepID=A0A165A7Z1_XYLHT|nr:hypothetical protein L228DRAFT_263380 [Xylona heveae TC161]KZF20081.1 hypothetical protein L228DRAFT_263380 [Xylona heveae TC161]
MRSQLTRQVFRRLLTNRAISHYNCPCRMLHSGRRPSNYAVLASPPPSSRRTIWWFSRNKYDDVKTDPDTDPGMVTMFELSNAKKRQHRPPPTPDLVKAFKDFFRNKQRTREPLPNMQATNACRLFKHLRDTNMEEEGFGLSLEDLVLARDALTLMPSKNEDTSAHNELARLLFEEIKRRKQSDPSVSPKIGLKDAVAYVKVLCHTGDSFDARAFVNDYVLDQQGQETWRLWSYVLRGFAREDNEKELLQTLDQMLALGVPFNAQIHQTTTKYYALKDNIEQTKKWYERKIAADELPTYHTNSIILKFCLRNNEIEWGRNLFFSILEGNPSKRTWDIIFQWAAAMGKGVDEVERMMEVMLKRNVEDPSIRPDVETINGLVEFASSRNDPYNAERYFALGDRWGIAPNAKSYILQTDYRIAAGDLSGARAAYRKLQGEEIAQGEDLPTINQLIRALCATKTVDFNAIVDLVEDLNDRKARLEPETASALCKLHLDRDEVNDVVDLLQTHSFFYSEAERMSIANMLIDFCLDRRNSITRIWEAYSVARIILNELPIEPRTRIMQEFFDRRRSDMACHVFGHMRQHVRADRRPTLDTYVECFRGIARAKDAESLTMVHNMLKMDMEIEPNTRMLNALMLAYTACDMPHQSLEYWEDIANSREGPTYSSIRLAFLACAESPLGEKRAQSIWQFLKKLDVAIPPEIYSAYLAALAKQGLFDEVVTMIDDMETETGSKPDALTLGSFYNAIPGDANRAKVQAWGLENYPEAWQDLVNLGKKRGRYDIRLFKIDQDVVP